MIALPGAMRREKLRHNIGDVTRGVTPRDREDPAAMCGSVVTTSIWQPANSCAFAKTATTCLSSHALGCPRKSDEVCGGLKKKLNGVRILSIS
jgi:hypothetical protein